MNCKMADLLIVGNGFDLYHGLPTRYTDFLKFINNWSVFWDNYSKIDTDTNDKQFVVRLSDKNELTTETMEDFASHYGFYKYEHLEYINNHLSNSWIQYFMKKQLSGVNWIDFEGEIYNVLRLIEEYYTEFIPEMRKKNDATIKYIQEDMLLAVNAFKNKCPNGYEDLTQGVLSPYSSQPDKIKKNKEFLLDTMKTELNDLIKCLEYYLLEFVLSIKVNLYSKQMAELQDVNLLNFNYTYTYANVYGKSRLKQHHRIHGDCIEENMVLGVPDEAFLNTLDYIYFQKYFQRIQKRTGNYYKEWITAPDPRMRTLEDVPINA